MRAIAALKGSSEPVFVECDQPDSPKTGEVLCRTLELGVCGTDREILKSANPLVPPGCDHLVLGHECLGRVEQVGPGVDKLAPGDYVVPVVRRAMEPSRMRPDLLAFGEYTERGIVQEHGFSLPLWIDRPEHLLRVSPEITSFAVLAEPVSVAEKGINEAIVVQRARLGEHAWTDQPPRVLVTGLGPIAFSALLACRCRDWPVAVYGRDEPGSFRASLAQSLGGRYLSASGNALEPADVQRDGYDLILECTGSDQVMVRASQSLAARGVMVWLGSSRVPKPGAHDVARMMRNGVLRNHVHIGSVNAARRDFLDALEHLEQTRGTHPKELAALVTHRVAPRESLDHFRRRTGQGIKTVLMYS